MPKTHCAMFLLLLLLLLTTTLAHPPAVAKREANVCPPYEQPVQNTAGEERCIPRPGSCANTRDYVPIACLVSPCTGYQSKCPKATYCYTDACNACKARAYDADHDEICLPGPFGDVLVD